MQDKANIKLLIGISGGIACYKTINLIRLIQKQIPEASIEVIVTPSVKKRFINPGLIEGIVHKPVWFSLWQTHPSGRPLHVALAEGVDLMVVAPCTATTLSRLATGSASTLLSAVFLSLDPTKVIISPSMEEEMYINPLVQENLSRLRSAGVRVIEPEHGYLASGKEGIGRMPDPEKILQIIKEELEFGLKIKGKKFLVTAGPTREHIDPIRYISNIASGRLGWWIARHLVSRQAEVFMVAGPGTPYLKHSRLHYIPVTSANEMNEAVRRILNSHQIDCFIGSAAVSDFTPETMYSTKIRKETQENLVLKLTTAPSVLETASTLRDSSFNPRFIVAFALETDRSPQESFKKLGSFQPDIIVYNRHTEDSPVAGSENTRIQIIDGRTGNVILESDVIPKSQAAKLIIKVIADKLFEK